MSDSVRPHRQQPTRLPRPWDSPGKNTGVGCHFLLQCMKVKSESEVDQSCPTLSDPMDCSLPGSSIHGIFQARVLEWGAIAFSVSFPWSPLNCILCKSSSLTYSHDLTGSYLDKTASYRDCKSKAQSEIRPKCPGSGHNQNFTPDLKGNFPLQLGPAVGLP